MEYILSKRTSLRYKLTKVLRTINHILGNLKRMRTITRPFFRPSVQLEKTRPGTRLQYTVFLFCVSGHQGHSQEGDQSRGNTGREAPKFITEATPLINDVTFTSLSSWVWLSQ